MFYKGYPDELIHISKKALWNNKDTWGYVWNQSLYRQANVRGAVSGTYIFKVIAVGEYVLYRYFNFSVGLPNGEIANANRIPIPIYYVSKNLNSPLYRADITHMDKVTAKDPIFSKLEKYLDKAPDSESFEFLVEEYIKNSKEYKPLKDLLPSAKK